MDPHWLLMQNNFGSPVGGLEAAALALFANGEEGTWYDSSDLSTLFQERTGASATTPATVGDPVGTRADRSGNNYYMTAGADDERPILRQTAGGLYYLEYDGSNDKLRGEAAFGATDPIHIIVAASATNVADNEGFFTVAWDTVFEGFHQRAVGVQNATTVKVDARSSNVTVAATIANVNIIEGVFSAPADDQISAAVNNNSLTTQSKTVRDLLSSKFQEGAGLTDANIEAHIFQSLCINRILSDAERLTVATLFAQKSGATLV